MTSHSQMVKSDYYVDDHRFKTIDYGTELYDTGPAGTIPATTGTGETTPFIPLDDRGSGNRIPYIRIEGKGKGKPRAGSFSGLVPSTSSTS